MNQGTHVPIQVEHDRPGSVRVSAQKAWADPLPPDHIEGRTITSLVSPGTELEMLQQDAPGSRVLGYAAVIEVDRTGENVSSISPGQRVFALAPHQTLQRIPEAHAMVIPDGLSADEAVFARFVAVPSPSLLITRARPSHRVLITGLGIVGNMAAQVFRSAGYAVTAVDPVARRRDLAAVVGLADIHENVPREAQFSLAVDCSGHERAVVDAAQSLTPGGELILVGAPWRAHAPEITAHDVLDVIFHRRLTVRSGWEFQLPFLRGDAPAYALSGSLREMHATALRWLSEGRISVKGLVDAASPFDAERVYADLRTSDWLSTRFDWAPSALGG